MAEQAKKTKQSKHTLIIVESPTKANTISRYLGSDCDIIASKGHIRTLPKMGLCIDTQKTYAPEYIIDSTKEAVIAQLKAALKKADELILATDEDREGESISWHLLEVLKPTVPYRRMVFHEITKKAILEAFENGRDLDMNLVSAQEARRVLDRLYGYTISPVLWSKLSIPTLSAGRVQSPGLRLIVEKERARLNFKKSEYWDIKATFKEGFYAKLESLNGKKIAGSNDFNSETGKFEKANEVTLLNYESSAVAINSFRKADFVVENIQEEEKTERPAEPFRTSTLQQEGYRKLHLAAKDTMKIAQDLYEKGFITYMRTDSVILSNEGINAAKEAAIKLFGSEYVSETARHYESKSVNAQEAHEAIRPAGESFILPEDTGLTGRELSLYTLIFKRTLASQMKNALKLKTTVKIKVANAESAVFKAVGNRIVFPGFIKVYVEGTDTETDEEESAIPKLSVGETLKVENLENLSHTTREPSRYTEASLVQKLEKEGIGRPSTYASIIDRIVEKGYVVKESGSLVPTYVGFAVMQLLENFKDYIDYGFTKKMEDDLDKIANGELKKFDYLKNFYEGSGGLEQKVKAIKDSIVPKQVKKISLPQIADEHAVTIGKFGPYVMDKDGKCFSIPTSWYPANTTDEMIVNLINKPVGTTATPIIGTTPDGRPVMYCTGKFGDYWQIGDKAKTDAVQRFKVPKELLGKDVSIERILQLFSLPIVIGTLDDGSEITADIGRYGAYLKNNDDFRPLKSVDELFSTTESEARKIFSMPKPKKSEKFASRSYVKKTKSSASGPASKVVAKTSLIVKDFGLYEGKKFDIRSGKYGFYIKFGTDNVRIEPKYQHDEELCKSMTLEEAASYLKK